jgi:hypothetical protein
MTGLTVCMLAACRRLGQCQPLDDADREFLAALLVRARLQTDGLDKSESRKWASVEIAYVYLWFWRAISAMERAAPVVADLVGRLPTPQSALDAAIALSSVNHRQRPHPREHSTGVKMAREAIADLVAACRERGILRPEPRWSMHDARPYAVVIYPQDNRGRAAMLLRGEMVVMGLAFGDKGATSGRVEIIKPHLLPIGMAGAPMGCVAQFYTTMIDLMISAAAAAAGDDHVGSRRHATVGCIEVQMMGPFDVPRGVSAALLAGDRPDGALIVARLDDAALANWLCGRENYNTINQRCPNFDDDHLSDDDNGNDD